MDITSTVLNQLSQSINCIITTDGGLIYGSDDGYIYFQALNPTEPDTVKILAHPMVSGAGGSGVNDITLTSNIFNQPQYSGYRNLLISCGAGGVKVFTIPELKNPLKKDFSVYRTGYKNEFSLVKTIPVADNDYPWVSTVVVSSGGKYLWTADETKLYRCYNIFNDFAQVATVKAHGSLPHPYKAIAYNDGVLIQRNSTTIAFYVGAEKRYAITNNLLASNESILGVVAHDHNYVITYSAKRMFKYNMTNGKPSLVKESTLPYAINKAIWHRGLIYGIKGNDKNYPCTHEKAIVIVDSNLRVKDAFVFESMPKYLTRPHSIAFGKNAIVFASSKSRMAPIDEQDVFGITCFDVERKTFHFCQGHIDSIWDLDISSDNQIFTASEDGQVRRFRLF